MKPVPTRLIRRVLAARGCVPVGTEGSHEKWQTPGGLTNTLVAGDKEQSAGLLRNIQTVFEPEFGPKLAREGPAAMKTISPSKHRATVEWDGSYWIAIPESGGVTQAKRLDQLPERLAEVIRLMTGQEVPPEAIELDIHYDDELGRQAAELRQRRAEIEASERELAEQTAATARALRDRGMNLRDIGTLTGMSYQRIHQLVS